MPALSVADVVTATGGELLKGNADARVESASIDTRELRSGGMFFALRGKRTDGHKFLAQAARGGAALAVVHAPPEAGIETPPAVIRVDDVEQALGRCGALARRRSKARHIALTGSNGKTTTKELIAAGLQTRWRVHRTPGNLNNQLGVPLTLLGCPDNAEIAVIELGMNAPGEIAALTRMVDPEIGVLLNVSPAHIEFFESLDDLAAAKGELFAVLNPDGKAVVNLDDEQVRVQAARFAGERVTFGRNEAADLVLVSVDDRFVPGARLVLRHGQRTLELQLQLGGAHNARNALAALATVLAAQGDLDDAVAALARVRPGPGRGEVHQLAAGVTLIDDSYNSSPSALASVLETMSHSQPEGRKILVMGDMLELGRREGFFHREAGRRTARAGVKLMVGVGTRVRTALEAARKAGVPETRHEKNAAAAAEMLPGLIRPGDLLVVKGSRAIRLERVVQALLQSSVEVP